MTAEIPPVSLWLQNGFHRFLRSFLKRHFHAIGLDRNSSCADSIDSDKPLIVYGNHPSWWDPLLAHFLNRTLFPKRQFYAPIDADALEQYPVFAKLGFYGVRMHRASGAGAFLKQSLAILAAGNTAIWMTPEGRFADARDRTATLMPGLAHLCSRLTEGCVLPIALEYVFWEERLPVCLITLGKPLLIEHRQELSKKQWSELLEAELRAAQDRLCGLAIARRSEPFDNLLHGKAGAGWFYDGMRRVRRWRHGGKARVQHGKEFE